MEINSKTPQEEMQDLTSRISFMTDTITGTDCECFDADDILELVGEMDLLRKELVYLYITGN